MPMDSCQFFHECAGCQALLRPMAGDCCVFCSYGSVPCPPIQQGAACGGASIDRNRDADADCCGAARPVAAAVGRMRRRVDA